MRKFYFVFISILFFLPKLSNAQTCASAGKDGAGGILTGMINTYYPATSSAAAGSTSLNVGTSTGNPTTISAGDLLLVIQMQDASINNSNSIAYGNGSNGSGNTALNSAGLYEYVVAAGPVSGGVLNILGKGTGNGLINSYHESAATGSQGQSTFQIIRVPQYTTATLGSTLKASYWNGSTGGVLAFDVQTILNLGSATVSLAGEGFRGGGGIKRNGGAGTDGNYVNLSTAGFNGTKGEGIAGTPRYTYSPSSASVNDNGIEGYPSGDLGRGAPGNAGGGGTDGDHNSNSENTGGGGGANQGAGGKGGNSWSNNLPYGGLGGSVNSASSTLIFMGGGGGAGTSNDFASPISSGGSGGGIVMIRAGSVTGTGTIDVSGTMGVTPQNEGGGGGGAAGSISVLVTNGNLTGLTAIANGAAGTNAWPTVSGSGNNHGPGGGGGGFIYTNSATSSASVAAGLNGTTTTSMVPYGATAGTAGTIISNGSLTSIPGTQSGAQCSLAISPSQVNNICNGGSFGSATATVTGGNQPYTYTWTGSSSTTATASNLIAGTYSVQVKDATGNIATQSFTITQPAALVINSTTPTNITCNGGNNGSIVVNASGGTGTITYSKDGGITYQASSTFSTLTAGTYNIFVKDANNCTSSTTVTLTQPAAINAYNVTGGGNICPGGTGNIALSNSDAGVNYQLQLGGVNQGSAVAGTGAALNFSVTLAGTYTILATNVSTSCTQMMSGSAVLTVNPLPTQYNVTGGGAYCAGGSGSIICLANSDIGVNYQLVQQGLFAQYYNGQTLSGSPIASQVESTVNYPNGGGFGPSGVPSTNYSTQWTGFIIAPVTGNYTFTTISDDGIRLSVNGNQIINNWTVHAPTTNNSTSVSLVAGQAYPILLQFFQNLGGTQAQLEWSYPGQTTQIIPSSQLYTTSQIGPIVAGTGSSICFPAQTLAGTYYIIGTNGSSSCMNPMSGSATITINPLPTQFTVTGPSSICSGSTGTISLSGSQTGVKYQLQNGGVNQGSSIAGTGSALSFSVTTAGTYTVLATNTTTTCSQGMSGSISLSINPLPTQFTVTGPSSICSGSTGTISLSGSQSGVNYQLQNGGVNQGSAIAGTGSGLSFSVTTAGTYTVVATNASTTCTQGMTGSVILSLTTPPTTSNAGSNQTFTCSTTSATLSGNNPTVGTGLWTQFSGPNTATITSPTAYNSGLTGLIGGTYVFTWTISNGVCAPSSSNVTITIPTIVALSASSGNVSCYGKSDGIIIMGASGGSGSGYQFSIDNGAHFSSGNTFTSLAAGTYTLLVKDGAGCLSTTQSLTVTQPVDITLNINNPSAVYQPFTVDITAPAITAGSSTGLTYSYFQDAGATIPLSNPSSISVSGTYYIKGTNIHGCYKVAPVTVTVNSDVLPTPITDAASGNAGSSIVIANILSNDITGTYAIDPSSIDLDPSTVGIQNTFTVPGSGTYSVTGTGQLTFTPLTGFSGKVVDSYTIADIQGFRSSSSAPINITVNPLALNDTVSTNSNVALVVNELGNDLGNLNPASVTIISGPTHGTVSVDAVTGKITYTPNFSFQGSDKVVYQVCDKTSPTPLCTSATIVITVVSQSPIAKNDNYSVNSGSVLTTNASTGVLANDTDPQGQVLSAFLVTGPVNGTLSSGLAKDGSFTYTPGANFSGKDSLQYRVCNSGAKCSIAEAYITVNPVANNDNASTAANTATVIDVLSNDLGNLNPGSVSIATNPSHGTVTIDRITGKITYTPTPGYSGSDSFSYTVCDKTSPTPLCSSPATVTVTTGAPVLPIPVADQGTTTAGTNIVLPNITSNDTPGTYAIDPSSVDLDPTTPGVQSTYTVSGQGTYSVNSSGVVSFSPAVGFSGNVVDNYTVADIFGNRSTSTAPIAITVNPLAKNDTASTTSNTAVTIAVLSNDLGNLNPSSITIGTPPAHGTLNINTSTGQITYTPNSNYVGSDSFTYTVCDKTSPTPLCSSPATVVVNTGAKSPIGVNDFYTVNAGSSITATSSNGVLVNDSDPQGEALSTSLNTGPVNGVLSNGGTNGTFTYTPNPGFSGKDSLRYNVCNTSGLCSSAEVFFTVNPSAINDTVSTIQNSPVLISVLSNDLGNINPATVKIGTNPNHGTISVDPITGKVTYTPNTNYAGTDNFTYSFCDKTSPVPLCSNYANVLISVGNSIPPTPVADNGSTISGNPVVLPNITLNDKPGTYSIDPAKIDLDPLTTGVQNTFTVAGQGTFSVNSTGALTFTPSSNFSGIVVDNYLVADIFDNYSTSSAPITIKVYPNAVKDSSSTLSNTPVILNVLANDLGNLNPGGVSIASNPSHGTVVVDPVSGKITYTPNPGFTGSDSFTYTVCDKTSPIPLCSSPGTVIITTGSPVLPIPVADQGSTIAGVAVILPNLTTNDTPGTYAIDPSSIDLDPTNPGVQQSLTLPGQGAYSINSSGVITFTPASNYTGNAIIHYTVADIYGNRSTSNAPITIAVSPVANNDTGSVYSNFNLTLNILQNDLGNLDPSKVTIVQVPTHGNVTVDPSSGIATYVPNTSYQGIDTFTYKVCDRTIPVPLCSNIAKVSIQINAKYPLPVNDLYILNANSSITTTTANGVLANDKDPQGELLTASLVTNPINGKVSGFNSNGTFTYTPNSNYSGVDSLQYRVCNSGLKCVLAEAFFQVNPVAVNDTVKGLSNTALSIPVLKNDIGNLNLASLKLVTGPSQGTLVIDPITGNITYTPTTNYVGSDSFTYSVCDKTTPNALCSNTATVIIGVGAQNPVGTNDSYTLNAGTSLTTNTSNGALVNDKDPQGQALSTSLNKAPVNGKVSNFGTDGTFTYTPNSSFSGNDSLKYNVCNVSGACSTAEIYFKVNPVAKNDTVNISYNVAGTINELSNDLGNLDPSTVKILSNALHGTLKLDPVSGKITYTPNPNYYGTDLFTYSVCDKTLPVSYCSGIATVYIQVLPPQADLTVSITTGNLNPTDGNPVIYHIHVANLGPNTGHSIVVTNIIPAGTTLDSLKGPAVYNAATKTLTISLDSLKSGDTVGVTYQLMPTTLGTITNSVNISGKEIDPNLLNNSSKVTIDYELSGLKFGNVFTPNGSSLNNTFEIKGLEFYPNNTIEIFNRWGNQVYHASGYGVNNLWWDGSQLNDGTYYYILKVYINGNQLVKGGYITILRSPNHN